MTLSEFRLLPLIRRFISLDNDTGDLLMHEVRRDPKSGLTLTLGLNPLDFQHPLAHKDPSTT